MERVVNADTGEPRYCSLPISMPPALTVVHVASSLPVAASVLTWPAGHIPQEVPEIQDSEARVILAEAIRTAEDTMGGRQ